MSEITVPQDYNVVDSFLNFQDKNEINEEELIASMGLQARGGGKVYCN